MRVEGERVRKHPYWIVGQKVYKRDDKVSAVNNLKKWALLRGVALGVGAPVLATVVVGAITKTMEFGAWTCLMALFVGCMTVEVYAKARWNKEATDILDNWRDSWCEALKDDCKGKED